MFDCNVTEKGGYKVLCLKGRIDGMSSPEIQKNISDLTLAGERTIVIDFMDVNYISSAGLRVFLTGQKQLMKAGGELILYRVSDEVLEVFELSGFTDIFRMFGEEDFEQQKKKLITDAPDIAARTVGGIALRYVEREAESGEISVIGSQGPLQRSGYAEGDVASVRVGDIRFGTGLATRGDDYEDYSRFFGETMIIDRNFFFFPAVKRPAVDFMFAAQQEADHEYRFLHGFGFSGDFRYIVSFENPDAFVDSHSLVNALLELSGAAMIGIVLLAESKGFWGMHLMQVPLAENRPADGGGIFDPDNFTGWMNFPVEPDHINNVIAATGIAVRDKSEIDSGLRELFSKDSNFHMHAGVFAKEPVNLEIGHFESELDRVLTEFDVSRIQHMLGQSRFSGGLAGIVELKG